ncbi:MAG: hypothetical protein ACWA5K_01525, partial [bacterium]
ADTVVRTPQRMNVCAAVRVPALGCALLLAGGCTTSAQPPEAYLRLHGTMPASTQRFAVCNQVDCETTAVVELNDDDWHEISALFSPAPTNAQDERNRIANALALMEKKIGIQAGTSRDRGRTAGAYRSDGQLDCIAETGNSTLYLLLLQQRGLLHRHRVVYPAHRGLLQGHLPHNTAVIEERATGTDYAVDSYFHDNGTQPVIVPIDTWLDGYEPAPVARAR